MANHKSALKRMRQSDVRRLRNKQYKTRGKSSIKEVKNALAENSLDNARESFKKAVAILQRNVSKGVIHKNNAARKISRLARHLNKAAVNQ